MASDEMQWAGENQPACGVRARRNKPPRPAAATAGMAGAEDCQDEDDDVDDRSRITELVASSGLATTASSTSSGRWAQALGTDLACQLLPYLEGKGRWADV